MPVRISVLLAAITVSLLQFSDLAAAQNADLSADNCTALTTLMISRAQIGLPTSGAKVTSATLVAADPAHGAPTYCLVVGEIAPIDKSAPNIKLNLGLPTSWNGRALMEGGGGTDGFVWPVDMPLSTTEGSPTPLSRGYVVFADDSGHQFSPVMGGAMLDGSFALNREALNNFLGDALKKTHDAAMAIIRQAYGKAPKYAYFMGGSGGGHEAFEVASRWPSDWDGVVAIYPAEVMVDVLGMLAASQTLAKPGAYPSPAKRALLFQAALDACDELDGVKDGIISDIRGCYARFDPAHAPLKGHPLRCLGGVDAGSDCLSDADLATFRKLDSPFPSSIDSPNGATSFPGFNIYTSDTGV